MYMLCMCVPGTHACIYTYDRVLLDPPFQLLSSKLSLLPCSGLTGYIFVIPSIVGYMGMSPEKWSGQTKITAGDLVWPDQNYWEKRSETGTFGPVVFQIYCLL